MVAEGCKVFRAQLHLSADRHETAHKVCENCAQGLQGVEVVKFFVRSCTCLPIGMKLRTRAARCGSDEVFRAQLHLSADRHETAHKVVSCTVWK